MSRLSVLEESLDVETLPWLAGRVAWLLGTLEGQQGQYRKALANYQRAEPLLKASGDVALTLFCGTLIAEVQDLLGYENSWGRRVAALQGLARHGHPRRRLAALQEAVHALERREKNDLAVFFTEELVLHARRWNHDLALLSALWQRAKTLILVGQSALAEACLDEARSLYEEVGEGAMQEGELADLRAVEALLLVDQDAAAAIDKLSYALATRHRIHHRYGEETLLLWRARAFRRVHQLEAAEQDLLRAVERHNLIADDLSAVDRVAQMTSARAAYTELAELRLSMGRWEDAFLATDAMHTLPFLRLRGFEQREALSIVDVQDALPRDVRLVELLSLENELLAFLVDVNGLQVLRLPLPRNLLGDLVSSWVGLLEDGASLQDVQDASAFLAESLGVVRPGIGQAMVVIAGPPLDRMPFGALWDRARKRYWLEDHPVSIVDSAHTLVKAAERPAPSRENTLVIEIGRSVHFENVNLPSLPGANLESSQVVSTSSKTVWIRNEDVSEETLAVQMNDSRSLYWVGHAVFNPQLSGQSGLVLVDSEGEGRLLDLRQIASMMGSLELVFLSSCSTVTSSSQSPLSIAAAFPNTPDVFANRWPLDDRVAARIGPLVFALTQDRPLAYAYREVLRDLWQEEDTFDHPSVWAGFTVMGGLWSYEDS